MFVSVVAQRLYYGAAGDDAMTCAGRVLIIVWTTLSRPLLLALHKFTYDVVATYFLCSRHVFIPNGSTEYNSFHLPTSHSNRPRLRRRSPSTSSLVPS